MKLTIIPKIYEKVLQSGDKWFKVGQNYGKQVWVSREKLFIAREGANTGGRWKTINLNSTDHYQSAAEASFGESECF